MKMTGHMMYGVYDYDKKQNSWTVHKNEKNEALEILSIDLFILLLVSKMGSI